MPIPRVYVETSIPSAYCTSRTDTESVARKNWTQHWWDFNNMNANQDSDLARIREASMRISERFHHDPELLIKHYIELQERHRDRLVFSSESGAQHQPSASRDREPSEK